jgi:LuxR family quorum sensing-dependent transcriptional regulator
MDLLDRCMDAATTDAAGAAMLKALEPLGACSLWSRSFQLTLHWTDPKVNATYQTLDHARIRHPDWWGSQAQIYADNRCPLGAAAARYQGPFFVSDYASHSDRAYAGYWEALAGFGVTDTLGVPIIGLGTQASMLSIWFERRDLSPREEVAIKMASLMLAGRMRDMAGTSSPPAPRLTPRESDAIAFVADGKSDWEVGVILGISQATVHTHVENAKRKLGASTRAQAVARALRTGLI